MFFSNCFEGQKSQVLGSQIKEKKKGAKTTLQLFERNLSRTTGANQILLGNIHPEKLNEKPLKENGKIIRSNIQSRNEKEFVIPNIPKKKEETEIKENYSKNKIQ